MALILNIESATNICSVSIARKGELLGSKETRDDKSHSSLLTIFIRELMSGLQIEFSDLDAVAVSKGPGSYTGLRIGVSTAKGIAYGAGLKLIGIPTLQTMAFSIIQRYTSLRSNKNILLCPMIDARRMEVFTAFYTPDNKLYNEITAEIIHPDIFSDSCRSAGDSGQISQPWSGTALIGQTGLLGIQNPGCDKNENFGFFVFVLFAAKEPAEDGDAT